MCCTIVDSHRGVRSAVRVKRFSADGDAFARVPAGNSSGQGFLLHLVMGASLAYRFFPGAAPPGTRLDTPHDRGQRGLLHTVI